MANCIASYNGSETNGKEMVSVINFFINKGLTPNHVAAIIGCMQSGSNFKTDAEITVKNKKYIGLCLWDEDRGNKLKDFAKQNNKEWTNLGLQLDFIWSELNGDFKKNVLDWFVANQKASIKTSVSKWEQNYEKCKDKNKCNTTEKVKKANEASKFYEKYAKNECSEVVSTNNDENEGEDNEGNVDQNNGESSGIKTDESKPAINCGIQVNGTFVNNNGGGSGDGTNENSPTSGPNTTDYKGKTLKLRLEREDFTCKRTIGSLYDTTDGKKQFICYIIEDRVRYTPSGKCCKADKASGLNPRTGNGPCSSTAIPYGTYPVILKVHALAKKGKHYFYGAEHKNSKYNNPGHIARLKDGTIRDGSRCRFDGVLLHATENTSKGNQDNTGGCLVTGKNKHGDYLSGTIEAFHTLYDDYIIPATEAGSSITIEIPRLHSDKDTGCYKSKPPCGQGLNECKNIT